MLEYLNVKIITGKNIDIKTGFYLSIVLCVSVMFTLFVPLNGLRAQANFTLFILCALHGIGNIKNLHTNSWKKLFWTAIFAFIIFLYKIMNISSASWGYITRYEEWCFYIFIGLFLDYFFSSKQKKTIFNSILLISDISIIYVCIATMRNIHVVDAPYSTMMMIFYGNCIIWFLSTDNRNEKRVSLFSAFISAFGIIVVLQKATNSILLAIMTLLILTMKNKNIFVIKIMLIVFGCLVLFLYYSELYVNLLRFLGDISRSDRLAERFNRLIVAIQYQDFKKGGGSLSGRYQLIELSINTWITNQHTIFFGVGDHRNGQYIGNHGEAFDTLGRYGVLGGFILMRVLLLHYKELFQRRYRESGFVQRGIICVFTFYIIRTFFGLTLIPETAIQLFVFTPLLIEHCLKMQRKQDII